MCGDDGGRQQHRLVFYNTFITTICSTGGRYYCRLGVISHTEHLISLVIYNTLYKSILFVVYHESKHVCCLHKPKTNSPNTCPRMPSLPKRGKTHGNERARPDKTRPDTHHWRQTGPALHMYRQLRFAIIKPPLHQNAFRISYCPCVLLLCVYVHIPPLPWELWYSMSYIFLSCIALVMFELASENEFHIVLLNIYIYGSGQKGAQFPVFWLSYVVIQCWCTQSWCFWHVIFPKQCTTYITTKPQNLFTKKLSFNLFLRCETVHKPSTMHVWSEYEVDIFCMSDCSKPNKMYMFVKLV